ncbi:hypothetical protein SAMN02799630_02618 [Paenibacillus sp. UNCCL117]|nr:hypothetical protein SAMN04488602_101287 [Paenibacillus sp. cl123]SFW38181.1 hypothetical protein SAMN02799630_02618 [Paenibacillus sp. UNCCL117]
MRAQRRFRRHALAAAHSVWRATAQIERTGTVTRGFCLDFDSDLGFGSEFFSGSNLVSDADLVFGADLVSDADFVRFFVQL